MCVFVSANAVSFSYGMSQHPNCMCVLVSAHAVCVLCRTADGLVYTRAPSLPFTHAVCVCCQGVLVRASHSLSQLHRRDY